MWSPRKENKGRPLKLAYVTCGIGSGRGQIRWDSWNLGNWSTSAQGYATSYEMLFGCAAVPFAFAAFSSAATGNLCAAIDKLKYSATDFVRAQVAAGATRP